METTTITGPSAEKNDDIALKIEQQTLINIHQGLRNFQSSIQKPIKREASKYLSLRHSYSLRNKNIK